MGRDTGRRRSPSQHDRKRRMKRSSSASLSDGSIIDASMTRRDQNEKTKRRSKSGPSKEESGMRRASVRNALVRKHRNRSSSSSSSGGNGTITGRRNGIGRSSSDSHRRGYRKRWSSVSSVSSGSSDGGSSSSSGSGSADRSRRRKGQDSNGSNRTARTGSRNPCHRKHEGRERQNRRKRDRGHRSREGSDREIRSSKKHKNIKSDKNKKHKKRRGLEHSACGGSSKTKGNRSKKETDSIKKSASLPAVDKGGARKRGASAVANDAPSGVEKRNDASVREKDGDERATNEARAKAMVPMRPEKYVAQQSTVREVFDEDTGRWRLIKGTGEIIERIVSRRKQQEIQQHASRWGWDHKLLSQKASSSGPSRGGFRSELVRGTGESGRG